MRRALLIFLTILLPLRGLMGDAMAIEMMPRAAVPAAAIFGSGLYEATNSVAKYADFLEANVDGSLKNLMPMPCHGNPQDEAETAAKDTCSICQLCHLCAFVRNA